MQADFSVELGPGDELLEIPWSSSDGTVRYYDLRRHPESIEQIPEAASNPPLKEFLLAINSRSMFASAKCDVWFTNELTPEEEVFGATGKFGGYVDLLVDEHAAVSSDPRSAFQTWESLLRYIVQELDNTPDLPASADLLLRRCYLHLANKTEQRLYFTLYVFGYADDEVHAQRNWARGLQAVQQVLLNVSPEFFR